MTPRGLSLLALLALAPGCLVDEALYEERRAELTDDDGDGHTEAEGDCADTNPNAFPGAAERCNGFDDDCDGAIDELDATNDVVWGADADGDGYAPTGSREYPSCAEPGPGWVIAWGDCDDTSAAVYPDAPEACDGLDNDCDEVSDEEPTTDPPTWYADEDGDGYGAAAEARTQCASPGEGWVVDGSDCDDGRGDAYPGASERCNGEDEDCDGVADEEPVEDAAGWYADADGDGYGDDRRGACAGTDGYVEVGGDCDDGDGAVHPGASEVCNDRVDNDCDGGPGACGWESAIYMPGERTIRPTYNDPDLGTAGAPIDLDGDGNMEFVVTAPGARQTEAGLEVGAVYGFELPIAGDLADTDAAWSWWGEEDSAGPGASLVVADFDGDGQADVQVGVPNRTIDGVERAGSLFLVYGPVSPGSALLSDLAAARIDGSTYLEYIGKRSFSVGDIDGDGLADVGAGYEYSEWGGTFGTGMIQLFTSFPAGTSVAADIAVATFYGEDENDELGADGCGVDIDGDGLSDVVLSAEGYDTDTADGAALIFFAPVSGTYSGDDADIVLHAEGSGDLAGKSVAAPGDTNDDGLDDLLVGAPQAGEGSAYLFWSSATLTSRTLGDADVTFRASRDNRRVGYVVRGLGDLNEDDAEDLFLSEGPNLDSWGYVLFGPFDTPGTHYMVDADITLTADYYDGVYTTAFTPGDATGDAVPDLVVGSYKSGTDYTDGAVFIMDGTGL